MIDFEINIYIMVQVLLSVAYIHSQGLILRDLKPNNIMIDPSSLQVYLIDFEHSKEIGKFKEEEENDDYDNENEEENERKKEENSNIKNEDKTNTCIGRNFSAPELEHYEYSEKSDSYSIGMIFHLLMTGINVDDFCLLDISKNTKNTLEVITKKKKELPKCPNKYFYIFQMYKNCCNILPKHRLSIKKLIRKFFNTKNGELQIVMENITRKIIPQFSQYLLNIRDFIDKFNKYIDESFIWYFLGYIFYYYGEEIKVSEKLSIKFQNKFNRPSIIELNKSASIVFLQISADKGNRWAEYILGIIYYMGTITIRDVSKAISYLEKASDQNLSKAQYFLGKILIDQNIHKAIEFLTLSANNYNSDAEYLLGKFYYEGIHVPRNVTKAFAYLRQSSLNNNSNADYLLRTIYFNGLYINKNIKKAIYYLDHAAQLNNSYAQHFLGELYYNGKYIQRDIKKAIGYLTYSAQNKNKDAQYLLGQIYYNQRDFEKAIYYLSNVNNEESKICLARIYYFYKKSIKESIEILHNASIKELEFVNIFLFYIYTYDKKDAIMAYKYWNQIPSIIQDILSTAPHENEKASLLKTYLQEFDLLNHNNDKRYLINYLLTGEFNIKDNDKKTNYLEQHVIDQNFRNGFNDGNE